ncbi:hypothetical protein [Actinoplanes flavus]|uniref:hypothetical protein n=1 Tax=Actinoplanes flavus TaxID=2820290 RepID=UPI001EE6032E|nr:hypothetical protein [Actinoplanes flavus]
MRHPIFARVYEKLSVQMDRAGAAEHRHTLVAGLRGRVIEIGCGNGLMFAHYPDGHRGPRRRTGTPPARDRPGCRPVRAGADPCC